MQHRGGCCTGSAAPAVGGLGLPLGVLRPRPPVLDTVPPGRMLPHVSHPAVVSFQVRLPRALCANLDVFGATTYPGSSRAAVVKTIIAEYLDERAKDPAGTAVRQTLWARTTREAFMAVADAVRKGAAEFHMRALAMQDQPSVAACTVFDGEGKAA